LIEDPKAKMYLGPNYNKLILEPLAQIAKYRDFIDEKAGQTEDVPTMKSITEILGAQILLDISFDRII